MDFPKITNFNLKKKLGHSICYTSYQALDKAKAEPCILKILNTNTAKNQSLAQEFLNHAQILTGLENDHICQVNGYHFDAENGNYYLISQPYDLQPLSALILDKFALSLEDLLDIFTQICDTLRYANLFGVLHGMLNPNSIFINVEGKIKIDDFGFNWYIPTLLKNDTKASQYLAQYIAPDYYQDIKTVDGRSDIYSIGLLLYEVISGKAPVSEKSVDAIKSKHLSVELPSIDFNELDLPIEIASIISKATNKSKAQRYQNFKELIDDFNKIKYKYIASSKYVEPISHSDIEAVVDEENPPIYKSVFPDFLTKKLIFSGAGAVFFVFLMLFVTNYIPLGHKEQDSFNNKELSSALQGEDPPAAEEITFEQEQFEYDEPVASKTSTIEPLPDESLIEKPLTASPEEKIVDTIVKNEPPILEALPQMTSATIYVISEDLPVQADIFVENKYLGKTNQSGEIKITDLTPDAVLNFKIIKDGYETTEKSLTPNNTSQTYTFDLKPITQNIGSIVFTAIPAADKIFIDGVLQDGATPQTITVQSGKHKVALMNSAYGVRHEETIDLENNQTIKINYDFTVKQIGGLGVSLSNAADFGFAFVYVDGKPLKGNSKTTPLEIQLTPGIHKISVKRKGFTCSPTEQVINIEKNKTKFVSFTLNRVGTN